MQNWLKQLLADYPPVIQYMVILALIMLLIYLCLLLTRKLGEKRGDKITFDDPDAYDSTVPNPLDRKPLYTRKKKK